MAKVPIVPLMLAAIAVTSAVTLVFFINLAILGSYDPRYAAFNGTAVVQTASMPATAYKFIYGGPGSLTTSTSITVYFLNIIRDTAYVKDYDLGKYLPIRLIVTSGSLPTNTYLTWTDPYGGRTRKLYLIPDAVSTSGTALIMGTYTTSLGTAGAAIVARYQADDNDGRQIIFYPIVKGDVANPASLCNILNNAGFGTSTNSLFTVVDTQQYDCATRSWTSTAIRWTSIGSGTYLDLRPSPTYYKVTISGSGYSIDLYLSYWYFTTTDPGFFAVIPG